MENQEKADAITLAIRADYDDFISVRACIGVEQYIELPTHRNADKRQLRELSIPPQSSQLPRNECPETRNEVKGNTTAHSQKTLPPTKFAPSLALIGLLDSIADWLADRSLIGCGVEH